MKIARRRFEAAWQSGQPQPIELFLPPKDDPRYLATLEELVAIELELRWKAARGLPLGSQGAVATLGIEDYLVRFPRLNQPDIVQRLREEEQELQQRSAAAPLGTVKGSGTPPERLPIRWAIPPDEAL